MLVKASYSKLLNIINSHSPNDVSKFNLKTKDDFIKYLSDNYSEDEIFDLLY